MPWQEWLRQIGIAVVVIGCYVGTYFWGYYMGKLSKRETRL